MHDLSAMTPDGQITIPRYIMKKLGISGGSDIMIEILNDQVILKKCEKGLDQKNDELIYEAV